MTTLISPTIELEKVPQVDEVDEDGRKTTLVTESDHFIPADNLQQNVKYSINVESKLNISAAILLLVTPTLILLVWLPIATHLGVKVSLESAAVGGQLTQVQAKVIDFICGVVIAPAIVALFDYLWFNAMRVTAVNECIPKNEISLETMSLAASTDSGSFHALKFWSFVNSREWSLVLFGFVLIFSAATKSLLSNIIAYEAFRADNVITSSSLVPLEASTSHLATMPMPNGDVFSQFSYNFDLKQQADFVGQFFSMMTSLSYRNNSNDMLDGEAYIGINATKNSLDSVPPAVNQLFNVPGYRLSIDCHPEPPRVFSITQFSEESVYLDAYIGPEKTAKRFQGRYHGFQTVFESAYSSVWTYVAFDTNIRDNSQFYLGYLSNRPSSQDSTQSPYGPITFTSQNQSYHSPGNQSASLLLAAWGLVCSISRQTGRHNLTRLSNGAWNRSSSEYASETDFPLLELSQFALDPAYQAPGSNIPGLGPVFQRNLNDYWTQDYKATVLNALYGIGETQRIVNDVYMSHPDANATYPVWGMASKEFYRITYVPLILLFALLNCIFASAIPVGLIIYNGQKKSQSFRTWRRVNGMRLLVDVMDGLSDKQAFKDYHGADNDELREWSKKVYLQYKEDIDENGVDIVLERVQKKER